MKKIFIPIVLGTAREGRISEKVAKFVFKEISDLNYFETELIDVKDFLFGKTATYSEASKPWQNIMKKADGLIIVSPEYNHGIPGELKILLDSLDQEYKNKPVAIVSVSSGSWGGSRMADSILPTLITLGMFPISPSLPFPMAQNLFDQNDQIIDNSYKSKIESLVKNISWYAEVLKTPRENKL